MLINNFESTRGTFNENAAAAAYDALSALDDQAPDSTTFEFDGVSGLFYGMSVYKGNEKVYYNSKTQYLKEIW